MERVCVSVSQTASRSFEVALKALTDSLCADLHYLRLEGSGYSVGTADGADDRRL